jgi:hypothetical protein
MQAARPLQPVFSLIDGLKLINQKRRFKALLELRLARVCTRSRLPETSCAASGPRSDATGSAQRWKRQAVVRAAHVGVRGCRTLAQLRHAPSLD